MDNLLAPMEFDNIWKARIFCKYNRCGICMGELKQAIIEPYEDFLKAHYNVKCQEHGLILGGGSTSIATVHAIEILNNNREYLDAMRNNQDVSDQDDARLLKELGF